MSANTGPSPFAHVAPLPRAQADRCFTTYLRAEKWAKNRTAASFDAAQHEWGGWYYFLSGARVNAVWLVAPNGLVGSYHPTVETMEAAFERLMAGNTVTPLRTPGPWPRP